MRVRILDEALDEYASAAEYYETQEAGLGQRFDEDLNQSLANALEFPHAGSPLEPPDARFEVRAVLLKTFSFRLIYALTADEIVMVAIMHTSRRPEYWRRRLGELG